MSLLRMRLQLSHLTTKRVHSLKLMISCLQRNKYSKASTSPLILFTEWAASSRVAWSPSPCTWLRCGIWWRHTERELRSPRSFPRGPPLSWLHPPQPPSRQFHPLSPFQHSKAPKMTRLLQMPTQPLLLLLNQTKKLRHPRRPTRQTTPKWRASTESKNGTSCFISLFYITLDSSTHSVFLNFITFCLTSAA